MNKKKFAKTMLDKNSKIFIIYITFYLSSKLIYLYQKVQMVFLLTEKFTILTKYLDILNIFLEKEKMVLLE